MEKKKKKRRESEEKKEKEKKKRKLKCNYTNFALKIFLSIDTNYISLLRVVYL